MAKNNTTVVETPAPEVQAPEVQAPEVQAPTAPAPVKTLAEKRAELLAKARAEEAALIAEATAGMTIHEFAREDAEIQLGILEGWDYEQVKALASVVGLIQRRHAQANPAAPGKVKRGRPRKADAPAPATAVEVVSNPETVAVAAG